MAARLGSPRAALRGAARGGPETGLAARVVGGNADVLGGILLAHWHHGALWLHCGAFECVLFCHHRPGQWHTVGAFCVVFATGRAFDISLVGTAAAASVHLCGVRLPVSTGLPLVLGLFAISRAAVHADCRHRWGAWCHVCTGGVQHRRRSLCPASWAARAHRASPHGPGLCRPPPATGRVWPLAYTAAHCSDATGVAPTGGAHPARYRHVREAERC